MITRIKTLLPFIVAAVLTACATTKEPIQPTAASPYAGIYVGKVWVYFDGIRKMQAPTKVSIMPDGKTMILMMQGPTGSAAMPVRGEYVSKTCFRANVPQKKILFLTILESLDVEARFSPDGKSAVAYSRCAGRKTMENSGELFRIGTPQAAAAENEWPSLVAKIKKYESAPRNIDLDQFYVENINTSSPAQISANRRFYGKFVVRRSNSRGAVLSALAGYDSFGRPLWDNTKPLFMPPASEIGIRPLYQVVDVPKENPLVRVGENWTAYFAKHPMLPF